MNNYHNYRAWVRWMIDHNMKWVLVPILYILIPFGFLFVAGAGFVDGLREGVDSIRDIARTIREIKELK